MSKKRKLTKTTVEEIPDASTTRKTAEKYSLPGLIVIGKNEGQKKCIDLIKTHEITVLSGYPGTGKTHIALMIGLAALLKGEYKKLILTRPVCESGERLGYLPGDFSSKIAPFMQPLMDIAGNSIGTEALNDLLHKGNIQVLPLAYMRGYTVIDSYLIADEMQNSNIQQMRMLLTRIGENSKIVITGDTEQSDLYTRGEKHGLQDCIDRFDGKLEEIAFFEMQEQHCVRSPLVAKIDKMYRADKGKK